MTSARDARSVRSDSSVHNNSVQECDACYREACAFADTDCGVFEARFNSETMPMKTSMLKQRKQDLNLKKSGRGWEK